VPDIFTLHATATNPTYITVLYSLLIALLMSFLIALTYVKTFRGLSYSRNFVQTLVLGTPVAAMIMFAIGDSLARGLGMIGALAIIRFRTNLKDSRDIIFIFASMAVGIACGVYAYTVGIVGAMVFISVAWVFYFIPFQESNIFDGIVKFTVASNDSRREIDTILAKYCRMFILINLRESTNKWDYAYHVKLKNKNMTGDLAVELKKINNISNVNLMLQETTIEL
jgi:uncharacterized membrane protein YhiD involved in acid resistance